MSEAISNNDSSSLLADLLNGGIQSDYSTVYLVHPCGGTISVDETYSSIYVSTSEYVTTTSGDSNTDVFIYAYITECYSNGSACTKCCPIYNLSNIDNNLALSSNAGYSMLCIDISQIPVNKRIVVIDCIDNLCTSNFSNCGTFNYDMQLQGHLHLHGYENVDSYSTSLCKIGDNTCNASKSSNYVDYIGYIPNLVSTDNYVGPLVRCIDMNLLSYGCNIRWDKNGNVDEVITIKVPSKDAVCRYNCSDLNSCVSDELIDACDLPPIDIRLLCQCDTTDKLPVGMFDTGSGNDSVVNLNYAINLLNNCNTKFMTIMGGGANE